MQEGCEDREILEAIANILPTIRELFQQDCILAVTDKEKFISYLPGSKIDIKAVPGQEVSPKSSSMQAINAAGTVSTVVPVRYMEFR